VGQLRHVLVHRARRLRVEEDDDAAEWIEGEPGDGPQAVPGPEFPVVLFLPFGQEESGQPRTRKVTRPTLMWEPVNADTGEAVEPVGSDDELLISAEELAAWFEQVPGEEDGVGRWQVDGQPQPFGPPGIVIGVQANLKAVRG
jgi:hypothetical protein